MKPATDTTPTSVTRAELVAAMARTFHVLAVADAFDHFDENDIKIHEFVGQRASYGADWMDTVHEATGEHAQDALNAAERLACAIEAENTLKGAVKFDLGEAFLRFQASLLVAPAALPPNRRGLTWVQELGHYLVMEACGTGVCWSDADRPDHGLVVPYVDFSVCYY